MGVTSVRWVANETDHDEPRSPHFYLSNGFPLSDDRCRFVFNIRWSIDAANKENWKPVRNWGSCQGITLVSDRASRLYLLGCHTRASKEFIDLYSIDLMKSPTQIVQKLANKQMTLNGGAHFRNASGIFVKSPRELVSYSTERDVRDKMTINVSP